MPGPPDYRVADRNAATTILGTWTPTPVLTNWLGVALPNRKLPGLPAGQDAPAPNAAPGLPTAFLGAYTLRHDRTYPSFEGDLFPPRWGRLFAAFSIQLGADEGIQELQASSLCATLAAASTPLRFFDTSAALTRTEGDYGEWHVFLLTVPFNATADS